MSAIVTLKKGEGRTIKAGGMWVFDNEIDTVTGTFENGEVVLVHDFDGYPMGRGFINVNSKIHVRMLTRKIDQEIDRAFLQMRVQNAWDYRKTTVDTSSCRVIFGEADFLPGLVVDKYEDVLVVECLALGMEQFKETIVELLKETLAQDGICIRGVYERSDANEPHEGRLAEGKGIYRRGVRHERGDCGEWRSLYGGHRERTEDRIFPGSEVQPPCHAADL